ncbi:MAG TPA: hypothetical protein VMZ32_04310, partial [Gammaproteobacteria bacterium]|nr:hypothetical protein [Gammaproteobacteria bacterium]
NGGTFNKSAGLATLSVDLINDPSSVVNVAGGSLIIDDAEINDPGTYNVAADGGLLFAQDRNLTGALNNAGGVAVGLGTVTTTLILPANLNNTGALAVNNAVLDLGSLIGNSLVMNSGTQLGGIGVVQGNVNNVAGVVAVGGDSTLGNLVITGTYTQGPGSVVVVTVLNNGVATTSDLLTVNGASQLNGGTLLTGYLESSLGLVTSNFTPINFQGGVSGAYSRTIDAGGITLFTSFNGNLLTVLGATPPIPESITSDLTSFIDSIDGLSEAIASNISNVETIVELLLEETGAGGLICN